MSVKVLVIPEDPTNNGYILKPLVEAILADAGKPAARVDVLTNPKLVDIPDEAGMKAIHRYACKMATGSGKTVVMAMLIAWDFCNRGTKLGDPRFPRRALVLCPNLTIKERLNVLRPGDPTTTTRCWTSCPRRYAQSWRRGRCW